MSSDLYIQPQTSTFDVLDFDGNSYVTGNNSGDASIYDVFRGDQKVEFKMWLDTSVFAPAGSFGQGVFEVHSSGSTDFLIVGLVDSSMIVYVNNHFSGKGSGIIEFDSTHVDNILQFEIDKTIDGSGDGSINYIKINGEEMTLNPVISGFGAGSNAANIGSWGSGELSDGTVWDIKIIETNTLVTNHYWKGYPAGDTSVSWVDVGDGDNLIDLAVTGGGPYSSRTIEGAGGSVTSMSKKLELDSSSNKGKLLLQGTYVEPPWLQFTTNASSGAYQFDPALIASGVLNWDLGDGSTANANSFTYQYPSGDPKTVKMYAGTVSSKDDVTSIDMTTDLISGEVDISEFKNLTTMKMATNAGLTSVITPNSVNAEMISFRLETCNITGSVDLSGYAGMGGSLYVSNNPNITSITFPDSSATFSYINVSNTGVSSLDFRPLSTLGTGGVNMSSCSNLTSVLFPDTSTTLSLYATALTSLIGTFDVSSLTGLYNFISQNNPTITDIVMPDVIADMGSVNVFNSGLTGEWDLTMLGNHFPPYFTGNNCHDLTGLLLPSTSRSILIFNMSACDLTGTLDVSSLTGLGGTFNASGNTNLTEIIFPVSSDPFTVFNVTNTGLVGTLDVSGLTGLGGQFFAYSLAGLTQILLPESSTVFSYFRADSCNLSGVLDMSGLHNLGGTVDIDGNEFTHVMFPDSSQGVGALYISQCPSLVTLDVSSMTGLGNQYGGILNAQTCGSLTSVLFPNTTNKIKEIYFSNCDITGTLDFTPLGGNLGAVSSGGTIDAGNNGNLTEILFPDTSLNIYFLRFNNCGLVGNLDLSGIYYLGIGSNSSSSYGSLSLGGNTELSSVTFPAAFQHAFTGISIQDCSLNQSTVDTIFSLLNTQFSAVDPSKGLSVNLDGGTNMPPTDGSSNSDILSLESIFSTAGQTLTITINE